MLLEMAIPGMVVIFLGMGAIWVAILQWSGVLHNLMPSFTVWFISSLGFLILLRRYGTKLFPGDVKQEHFDEDEDAYGAIVEVIENVREDHCDGRIRYSGTTWSAQCIEGEIKKGCLAKIVFRKDLGWVVEPYYDA